MKPSILMQQISDVSHAYAGRKRFKQIESNIRQDIADIFSVINEYWPDVTIEDIFSEKRKGNIVQFRHVLIYLVKKNTSYSLTELGSDFNRDHSTIIHAITSVENRIFTDRNFKSLMIIISEKLNLKI